MQPMESPSDISLNMPNASLNYLAYSATFGNIMFQVFPSQTGEVNNSFGTVPYFPLEGALYSQQIQAATNPVNTSSGSVQGQQNVSGALTVTDQSGNIVAQISAGTLASTGAAGTTTGA